MSQKSLEILWWKSKNNHFFVLTDAANLPWIIRDKIGLLEFNDALNSGFLSNMLLKQEIQICVMSYLTEKNTAEK